MTRIIDIWEKPCPYCLVWTGPHAHVGENLIVSIEEATRYRERKARRVQAIREALEDAVPEEWTDG